MSDRTNPITFDRSILAVTNWASTDDTRVNLTAVLFETDGTAIATNGHGLALLQDGIEAPVAPVLIDAGALTKAAKMLPAKTKLPVRVREVTRTMTDDDGSITFDVDLERSTVQAPTLPKSNFPDYTQVLPTFEQPIRMGFSVTYLKEIVASCEKIGSKGVALTIDAGIDNPDRPDDTPIRYRAEVYPSQWEAKTYERTLTIVLMPMRL